MVFPYKVTFHVKRNQILSELHLKLPIVIYMQSASFLPHCVVTECRKVIALYDLNYKEIIRLVKGKYNFSTVGTQRLINQILSSKQTY